MGFCFTIGIVLSTIIIAFCYARRTNVIWRWYWDEKEDFIGFMKLKIQGIRNADPEKAFELLNKIE